MLSPPRVGSPPRILLSEGSSLSAPQTLYALGPLGYPVDACDPRPLLCLARYSRYLDACYRCPPFARDPAGYVQLLMDRLRARRHDVLLPTHDQVFLLSRVRDLLRGVVGLPVPEFTAIERLQGKAEFIRLLDELRLPHPATAIAQTRQELHRAATFPCYVKRDYSTAGRGVWLVHD